MSPQGSECFPATAESVSRVVGRLLKLWYHRSNFPLELVFAPL